jgi:AN1-type zinc finger and ubiquitin domain-containing protein 1
MSARCSMCNKKVPLASQFPCKCGNMYCTAHRFPEEHSCSNDYKKEAREKMEHFKPVIALKVPTI